MTTEKTKAFVPEIVKNLILPILKTQVDEPIYFRVDSAIIIGKKLASDKDDKKEPARIMNVTNLVTGEQMQIVCNTILVSTLEEEYPDEKYVGMCFAATKHGKKEGKKYFTFTVAEIKDPGK